jgi:hypothetical protein
MHDALPLEPELEQVAVDQQRRRPSGQAAKKGDEQSLDVRRRVTQVDVGYDVAGWGKHAVSLYGHPGVYKRMPGRDLERALERIQGN